MSNAVTHCCHQSPSGKDNSGKWMYVYQTDTHEAKGVFKVGEFTVNPGEEVAKALDDCMKDQHRRSGQPYKVLWHGQARYKDGSDDFSDKDVHKVLEEELLVARDRTSGATEVFITDLETILEAFRAVRENRKAVMPADRKDNFASRKEQAEAVQKTAEYFRAASPSYLEPAEFLWNAKMRFGKTFTTYQLVKEMGWKRVAVITFIPSVEDSWKTDLLSHNAFTGWHYVANGEEFRPDELNDDNPVIWFTSFQALSERDATGALANRFFELENGEWDCVVLDEYHYGSHNDNSKRTLDKFPHKHRLLLSGTPFRELDSGRLSEEQIFTWSYVDEQREKAAWDDLNGGGEPNPYAPLPSLAVLTYQVPSTIQAEIAFTGTNGFELKEFFAVAEDVETGEVSFRYEHAVRRWLASLSGDYVEADTSEDVRSEYTQKASPFRLLKSAKRCEALGLNPSPGALDHTLWALPNVKAVSVLAKLLRSDLNFSSFEIIEATGEGEGSGGRALQTLKDKIKNSGRKTITLTQGSQGMLTTGVTVPEWSGVFLLHDSERSEGYFQTIFRSQSPQVERYVDENGERRLRVLKEEAYVFDFSPQRTIKKIYELRTRAESNKDGQKDAKEKSSLQEVLNFLPVISVSGGSFSRLPVEELIEWATDPSGVTADSYVRDLKGTSPGTSDAVVQEIFDDPELLEELRGLQIWAAHRDKEVEKVLKGGKLSGFTASSNPALTDDLQRVENENKKDKEKPGLTDEEKETLAKAKKEKDLIRKVLSYLKNRLPLFMFLTDDRESALVDVIEGVGAALFKETTNISKEAFAKLVDIGAFDRRIWDGKVNTFRLLEAKSLAWIDSSLQEVADKETAGMFHGVNDPRLVLDCPEKDVYALATESAKGLVCLVQGTKLRSPGNPGPHFHNLIEAGEITDLGEGLFELSGDVALSFPSRAKASQFVLGDLSATGEEWTLDDEDSSSQ